MIIIIINNITEMQNQIHRILTSDISSQIFSSLQTNQQQITKLQQILAKKNNQVNQLHKLINEQLHSTIEQNNKFKQFYQILINSCSNIKNYLISFKNFIQHLFQSNFKIFQELIYDFFYQCELSYHQNQHQNQNLNLNLNGKTNQQHNANKLPQTPLKMQQTSKTQKIFKSSNSHLFQRLQKMQKLVLTLKQQKRSLQKQIKKYQQLYHIQLSPQPQYNSIKSLTQQQKKTLILKTIQINYLNLQQKKYQGQIIKNQKNGQGICQYHHHFIYQGHFINNLKNGFGILKYQNVIIYQGFWKNGTMHGKGYLYFFQDPNIVSFCGFFNNGKIQGYGTFTYTNGLKIRGYFDNQKIQGPALIQDYQNNRLQYGYINQQISIQHYKNQQILALH